MQHPYTSNNTMIVIAIIALLYAALMALRWILGRDLGDAAVDEEYMQFGVLSEMEDLHGEGACPDGGCAWCEE